MKRIFYVIFYWLICTHSLHAQTASARSAENFEGIITYRLMMEAINPMLSTSHLQAMFGDTMKLYLKDNNFKMVFTGVYAREILYAGNENKHYISLGPADTLMWRSCNENASGVVYVKALQNTDHVLDYECNSYTIQTDWGITTYYYSPKFKLDPKKYNKHIFNNFDVYVRYARAPYLKYVYTGPSFKLTLIAVNIETEHLENTDFEAVWKPTANKDFISK